MANTPAPSPLREPIKLEDVLITGQLYLRPQKGRDPREEAESLQRLARVMARKPHKLVETLLEMAFTFAEQGLRASVCWKSVRMQNRFFDGRI